MDRYELVQESLPANVDSMKLPRYPVKICQLFKWDKWSALGWIRVFYITAVIFILFMGFILFVSGFFGGVGGILFSLLVLPFLLLLWLAGMRIASEVMLAVLIMPHQLHKTFHESKEIRLLLEKRPIINSQAVAQPLMQAQSFSQPMHPNSMALPAHAALPSYNMQHIALGMPSNNPPQTNPNINNHVVVASAHTQQTNGELR